MAGLEHDIERALVAAGDELNSLLYHPSYQVLSALLKNPAFDESKLTLLLGRKDAPVELLEEIGTRKTLLKNYAVKRALIFHPRTPRLIGLRLIRDLYVMDLVQLALSPAASMELRRLAEEQLIARLPQLPLGQRITLARRGPARVAGALLAQGNAQVLPIALNNSFLTESQILKVLAREKIAPQVAQAIANHPKWSQSYNVRLALVRTPTAPLAIVLGFLPQLTVSDLRELTSPGIIPENLRRYLQAEVQRRIRTGK
ncbi:MAG TPA: hypothetical protein VGI13_17485 [Candidatus Acidoferrum sp.]